jgi:hypothetical protein
MMDPPDSTDLALRVCPTDTHSPHSLCFHLPLFPFFLFSYAHPFIPFVNTQREWTCRVLITEYKNPVPSHSKKREIQRQFPLHIRNILQTLLLLFKHHQTLFPHCPFQLSSASLIVSAVSAIFHCSHCSLSPPPPSPSNATTTIQNHQSHTENSCDPRRYT